MPFFFIKYLGISFCCAVFLIAACSQSEDYKQTGWTESPVNQSELDYKAATNAGNKIYEHAEIPEIPFNLSEFVPDALHDSLLTDLIVLIYRRPPGSKVASRYDAQFRGWYVDQLTRFHWIAHQVKDDWHYFLLKRPARNIHGHVRTVGGKFRLDGHHKITSFREIFNTPMLPEHEARVKGAIIFNQLMTEGHLGRYYLNAQYIEFPNEDCFYHVASCEWSYDLNKREDQAFDYIPPGE